MIELSSREALVTVRDNAPWSDGTELAQAPYQAIILDLSGLQTISPTAIGWILDQWEKLWKSGKELKIRGCNEEIRSTFQFLRMDRYIRFVP